MAISDASSLTGVASSSAAVVVAAGAAELGVALEWLIWETRVSWSTLRGARGAHEV